MDRLISEQEIINILMDNDLDHIQIKDGTELIQLVQAIPSADEDEWVKRSDVLKIVDKRVDERLSEPYKGMTNGEVIEMLWNITNVQEEKGMIKIFFKDIVQYWFPLKSTDLQPEWWNSPYEPQERSE